MTPKIAWPKLRRNLVAILRGIRPEQTSEVVGVLVDVGFEAIEIPLNSPNPFRSIEIAAGLAPGGCLIGGGTVLRSQDVARLASAGGTLLVSPNTDRQVIGEAASRGMVTLPGVLSPTEALAALAAGASALKFFPAAALGPAGISAIRAVLPPDTMIAAVGGVSDADFSAYFRGGIRAFGLGSSLFKPGATTSEIAERANAAIEAYDRMKEDEGPG